jgi:microcystin-dependent protein
MGYLTPNEAPGKAICRALFIPNNEECLAVVRGALEELTVSDNWDKFGALSREQAAALFVDMFDRFCLGPNQGCRMIGEIIAYAGETSPNENWLVCDGSTVNKADYPDLYNIIADLYGAATQTTCVLPNLVSRSMVGVGSAGGLPAFVIGDQGGEASHVVTVTEMPAHSHSDVGHSHTTGNSLSSLAVMPGEGPVLVPNPIPALSGSASANLSNTGGGNSFGLYHPVLGINYLIVAKDD